LVNHVFFLSYTTYYSRLVVAVVSTGLFSEFLFADNVSTIADVDNISETKLLKAYSTLVEFFDDVSKYDIFNDSANA
jgi:hypothetical protein